MGTFPITSKLIPRNATNIKYLLATAAITRMAVAGFRVEENRPSKNTNPELTPNQKKQSIVERFFVEIPGTLLFTLLPLHVGQDLTARMLEKHAKSLKIPQLDLTHFDSNRRPAHLNNLSRDEAVKLNDALRKVFGDFTLEKGEATFQLSQNHLIFRRIFAKEIPETKHAPKENMNAGLSRLKKELGPELFQKGAKAMPDLIPFARRLNRASCVSIMGGVVLSALFGGMVTQRLNDNVVAPNTKKWLENHHPEGGQTLTDSEPDSVPEDLAIRKPATQPAPAGNAIATPAPGMKKPNMTQPHATTEQASPQNRFAAPHSMKPELSHAIRLRDIQPAAPQPGLYAPSPVPYPPIVLGQPGSGMAYVGQPLFGKQMKDANRFQFSNTTHHAGGNNA